MSWDFTIEDLKRVGEYKYTPNEQEQKRADEVKKGLENVEKAVKELHPKEKTTLDKQLEEFLTGGEDARIAQAREKFLNMKTNERIAFQEENPGLFNAMFPKEEIPKPDSYEKLIAEVKADPKAVNKLPYNIKNYAFTCDPEGRKVIEGAMNFMMYDGVTSAGNPLFYGKYQGK